MLIELKREREEKDRQREREREEKDRQVDREREEKDRQIDRERESEPWFPGTVYPFYGTLDFLYTEKG